MSLASAFNVTSSSQNLRSLLYQNPFISTENCRYKVD
jgi:hypothetical protein